MCASCLFVNHFFVLLFFLPAACIARPHFAAPLQPAALAKRQNREVAATPLPSTAELLSRHAVSTVCAKCLFDNFEKMSGYVLCFCV